MTEIVCVLFYKPKKMKSNCGLMQYIERYFECQRSHLLWLFITTLSDSRHFLDQSGVIPIKPITTCSHTFSRASCRLLAFVPTGCSLDCLTVLCDWPERKLWFKLYDTIGNRSCINALSSIFPTSNLLLKC